MRKIILMLFISIFAVMAAKGQVTTTPLYPTENDSIVVFLDTTQPGAEELLNYTGTLYVHTGVNTNLGNWQHVIGSWGNNSTQPACVRTSLNSYKLVIGKPQQFYGITNPAEKINALSIVFRSSDASKQTRPDIFVNLFESGITVLFNSPTVNLTFGDPLRSPAFVSSNDTLNIDISAAEVGTSLAELKLYINDSQVAQTSSNNLTYEFISSQYSFGSNRLAAVAKDTSGLRDSTECVVFINPPVEDSPLPQGKVYGINYDDNSTVTLALFAPYKSFVYVLGDFNDWKVNSDYYLKRDVIDENNIVWWITISGLTPGTEYAFQYLVDGDLRIGDPYTDKVLDPSNDQYISAVTYPNLKPYPAGKTNQIVSVLQTDQTSYQWQVQNFQRPANADLVIYELLLRDFLAEHSFSKLSDTLSYLKNLGVNAIELMPVNEFEGNISWGYNPSFLFAVDKFYGPKNELKKLIDKAHEMGIAVIFDMVLNHAYGQSPLVRLYWDAANGRPSAESPWFNQVSPNPVFSFGYDFNHESQATKDYVDRVNRYWLEEYKFDGFRFDFTKGFTNTPGDGSSYDLPRINILSRMADIIWEYDSTAYVILEHFGPNNEEMVLAAYGMMLWGNMNYQYNEATMGYGSNLIGSFYRSRGFPFPHLIAYMESHDEERLMFKNLSFGNLSGSYNIKNLSTALDRMKLAAPFFFLVPGPKMIWQFGELGYDYSINWPSGTSNDRLTPKPIRWDYFSNPERLKLYKVFSELIKLRKNYETFQKGNFITYLYDYEKKMIITHPDMDAVIIGNFNVTPMDISPTFTNTGTWYDFFSGDSLEVNDVNAAISFQPGEFKIFTTVKLTTPEPGLITSVENNNFESTPTSYNLYQNFPNPFNPTTTIKYSIPSNFPSGQTDGKVGAENLVTLKIYDILGNEVATLVNEEKSAGYYEVKFDAGKFSSGVYFYQIKAGTFIGTKKMILLR